MADARSFAESPEAVGVDPRRLDELFTRAEREVRAGILPSVQLAIAREGKIAGMHSFGEVTIGGEPAPVGNDTLYCLFSATKAITAAAAWLLIQENRLGVDERVAEIIPEFGTHGKDVIRVEQLFLHTAGFPHVAFPVQEWNDRDRRIEHFAQWRLSWEPGSQFEYHPTSSMWVIRELIERRSGQDYREFVRKRILDPLGLQDLHVGLHPNLHSRVADVVHVGEEMSAEERREAFGVDTRPETEVTEDFKEAFNLGSVREAGNPGAGGYGTAADLALFYQGLLSGRATDGTQIWKPETLRMVREVRSGDLTSPPFNKTVNRALGVIIAGDADRNYRGFGHTGSEFMFGHGGAGGQLAWADPESGLSLGYCTNGQDRHELRMGRRGVGISSRAALCALK